MNKEPDSLTPEQRAFLASAGSFDHALVSAQALGAPPSTVNALLQTSPRPVACVHLYPLTIGGYILLYALGNVYVRGGTPRPVDSAQVILALAEPEWVAEHVEFDAAGAAHYDEIVLRKKLSGIAANFPVWAVAGVLRRFVRQLEILFGKEAPTEDDMSPLALTPAGPCPSEPVPVPANLTPVGSPTSTN